MRASFVVIIGSLTLISGILGCSTPSSKLSSSRQQPSSANPLRDAYLLYEMGKLDSAEQKLRAILDKEPDDAHAKYLLELVYAAEMQRKSGQARPWGYYPTFPPQPIYR
jgi:Tfp pilus assembly protein PilF